MGYPDLYLCQCEYSPQAMVPNMWFFLELLAHTFLWIDVVAYTQNTEE